MVDLSDERALDPDLVGAKAAALAKAVAARLSVLPGFVIPTSHTSDCGSDPELRAAWERLTAGGAPLVVRSSSTAEDGAESSMAGRFRSVVGVTGWPAFLEAVAEVRASAHGARVLEGGRGEMAVLVQPELDAVTGGVMFGMDPVSGEEHLVVSVVQGGPEELVSGEADGERFVLGFGGRVLQSPPEARLLPPFLQRLALQRLAARTARTFGGPQDMEWGVDRANRLWLFQSRPITARARSQRARGSVFGPGPLAETFPHALAPLEEDLWFEPVRAAVAEAFAITGAASRRTLHKRPVVMTIAGRAAADLEMFGYRRIRKTLLARMDLRGPVLRLLRSWRVGRLKMALPSLAVDLIDRVDHELAAVPPVRRLSDEQLDNILANASQMLVALHGYEVLVGALAPADEAATSAGSIALRALAEGRMQGLDDGELVRKLPWVLALVPPSLERSLLPDAGSVLRLPEAQGDETPSLRENLRMRVRWVQELTALVCREVEQRLAERGSLTAGTSLSSLRLSELRAALLHGEAPPPRADAPMDIAPLPAAFRLTTDGSLVAESTSTVSVAAGGGRVVGTVRDAAGLGDVLVVRTLDPDLAPLLPTLVALVAETGSPLSHLAILARELGVATVVGVQDATSSFTAGERILVDGSTGEVEHVVERIGVTA